ncbi:MAG: hypothetical protein AAGI30_03125 [Planctomycetota bacterium]
MAPPEKADLAGDATRAEAPIPCLRCGYDLRGLDVRGRCPECGAGVEGSLTGDALAATDTEWLKTLYGAARWSVIGARVAVWSIGTMFVGLMVWVITELVIDSFFGANAPSAHGWVGAVIGVVTMLCMAGAVAGALGPIAGAWFAASPEPNEPRDAGSLVRCAVRPLVVIGMMLMALMLVLWFFGVFQTAHRTAQTLGVGAALCVMLALSLGMRRLGRVCERSPSGLNRLEPSTWAKRTLVAALALSVVSGAHLVISLIMPQATGSGLAANHPLPVILNCGTMVLAIALVLGLVTLPGVTRVALRIMSDELIRQGALSPKHTVRPRHRKTRTPQI